MRKERKVRNAMLVNRRNGLITPRVLTGARYGADSKKERGSHPKIRVDPWRFAEQLACDLDPSLQRALGDKAEVAKVMRVVRRVLRDNLRKIRDVVPASAGNLSSTSRRFQALHNALPVNELKPKDVLAAALVDMFLPSLYRATEQGRFY